MYCNGQCNNLDEKKHLCRLTGEKLSYFGCRGPIRFIAHEHRFICPEDEKKGGTKNDIS